MLIERGKLTYDTKNKRLIYLNQEGDTLKIIDVEKDKTEEIKLPIISKFVEIV